MTLLYALAAIIAVVGILYALSKYDPSGFGDDDD